jgi:hypothetical protein
MFFPTGKFLLFTSLNQFPVSAIYIDKASEVVHLSSVKLGRICEMIQIISLFDRICAVKIIERYK